MDTTAAAIEAHVTVATIRTWCRRNVVAAVKHAGRWTIDAASLARRIAIGDRRKPAPQIRITDKPRTRGLHYGAIGDPRHLETAYQTGRAITITTGTCAGDRVHLGDTRQTYRDGITLETIGLDCELRDGSACYLIDLTRLDDAPRLTRALAARREHLDQMAAQAYSRSRAIEAPLYAYDN